MKRKAVVSFVLVVLFLVSMFPLSTFLEQPILMAAPDLEEDRVEKE